MLSEVSRQRKTKFYDPLYLCNLQALEPQTQRTDLWFQGQGWGGVGKWLKVSRRERKTVSFQSLFYVLSFNPYNSLVNEKFLL